MKTKFIFFFLLPFSFILSALAGSATWSLDPVSGDWNDPLNWMPHTVPNSSEAVATFDSSNLTDVFISGTQIKVDQIAFTPNASAFTITIGPDLDSKLTLSGPGIMNQSGVIQNLIDGCGPNVLPGELVFQEGATAGDDVVFTIETCAPFREVDFFDTSNAGSSTFIAQLDSNIIFNDDSSASSGTFINEFGSTQFVDHATAANATLIAQGGGFAAGHVIFSGNATAGSGTFTLTNGGGNGGEVDFLADSTADHATFMVEGADSDNGSSGKMFFQNRSTAGDSIITLKGGQQSGRPGGTVSFTGPLRASTAGNSTIIAENGPVPGSGGLIFFNGGTSGGTARLELLGPTGPGTLQIQLASGDEGVTVGSIEGSGQVILSGAGNVTTLSIGSNNSSTTFSGLIQDGGNAGSIGKIGTGTLTLSGANTYTRGTTISSGILLVSNVTGSGTGTAGVSVNAGTLGGSGIIAGAVTVGTNTGVQAFLAPSKGAKKPATLTIQGALTLNDDSTYIYQLNTKRAVSAEVIANGVGIDSGAKFSFRPSGNNSLTVGQIFTVINNTAATPIAGTFHNLPEGKILTVNGSNLQASYTGDDGNDLILTVVP